MVPESYIAWHAGKSNWKKNKNLNKYSIGIEIQNKGHNNGYESFSKLQIRSIIKISKYLIKKYNIKKKNILGHSDIAFDRKKDPGEKFPWEYLAKKKIGLWHNLKKNRLIRLRNFNISINQKKKIFFYLKKYGYFVKKNNQKTKELIKNFQRRFRPELVNGKLDKECYVIAKKVSEL